MHDKGNLHIGTSGWNYSHWKGSFYPEELTQKEWFSHYLTRFSTVEINNTFYSTLSEDAAHTWNESAPENFHFSVKANRYITHMKKLKDPGDSLDRFFHSIRPLGSKTDVILFQLPPKWKVNADRLKRFIALLPDDYRYTFEFRDPSWFTDEVFRILSLNNSALCFYHLEGYTSPKEPTADFVYIRLHGPSEEAYRGRYTPGALSGWAGAISAWRKGGNDVYCYFDNDEKGYAPLNALELKKMLE